MAQKSQEKYLKMNEIWQLNQGNLSPVDKIQ
jgi:hypothetical protein